MLVPVIVSCCSRKKYFFIFVHQQGSIVPRFTAAEEGRINARALPFGMGKARVGRKGLIRLKM